MPKANMKLKHVLPVACIASLLAACGSTAHTTVETPEPTSTAVSAMDEALKHTSGWGELDLSEYELPTKGTEHFSREQVDQVAEDVVGLLQNQLSYQSAGSQNDILDDVNAFVSDAPGELADYMKTKSQEDASDNDSPIWPLSYVQPIDSMYKVDDASPSTYAWSVKEQELHGTDGVAVTLFHRTFYKLQNTNGDENFILVARWLELSTIDPDYAATSGDYAWRLDVSVQGAEYCDAVNRNLLVPSPVAEPNGQNFETLLKVAPNEFKPKSDFKEDDKKLAAEVAKC